VIGFVLARRYAKAIIDLAHEQGVVAEAGEDLKEVSRIFVENPELGHAFSDPTVSRKIKDTILQDILGRVEVHDLTRRFLSVLLEKNRILGVEAICQAYMEYADEMANRIRAKVVTAAPLTKAEEKRIQATLTRLSGKEVVILPEVDESLLGGVVAYVGGQVFDGSLSNQLHQVKESLSKGR
jgi:F-type H+-transporting ATPase subunit delta